MQPHNPNTNPPHFGIVWFLWYTAASARALRQLVAIDYSDSTPDVAFTYDRLGRQLAVTYAYDAFGRFSTVSVSNGTTFTYSYVPDSSLLAGYTNDLGLAVAYEYEPLRDVKTLVSNAWGTNVVSTLK